MLQTGKAKAIYDIDAFVSLFSNGEVAQGKKEDAFLEYCKASPTYEEALTKFPDKVFEAELNGEIEITNGMVILK